MGFQFKVEMFAPNCRGGLYSVHTRDLGEFVWRAGRWCCTGYAHACREGVCTHVAAAVKERTSECAWDTIAGNPDASARAAPILAGLGS